MMAVHGMDPAEFLDYVHDVDLHMLDPDPQLREYIKALPGRKFIFTNGSKGHARNVAGHLNLFDFFIISHRTFYLCSRKIFNTKNKM